MNDSKISIRYSRALFESAMEKGILEQVFEDMRFVSEICKYKEIKELLTSPIIIPSKKQDVLHGILEKNVCDLTLSLVDLVVKNGREAFLPAITRRFLHEINKYKGITESSITTAVPLQKEVVEEVKSFISKTFDTNIDLKQNVDTSIIGGFILRVDDNYIDTSIKTKLKKIEKELKETMFT